MSVLRSVGGSVPFAKRRNQATPLAELPRHLTAADLDLYTAQVFTTGEQTAQAIEPFTGALLPPVPQSSAADVSLAAARGRSAQVAWAARPLSERAKIALRFGELLLGESEKLIDLVQWETGKSRVHAGIEALGVGAVAAHYGAESAGYLAP